MKNLSTILAGSTLTFILACSGGGSDPVPPPPPANATRLTYTDPATTVWRFAKVSGTGSTTDPLILELRGPSTPQVKGAAFFVDLGSSSKVVWHALNGSSYSTASTNMGLGTGVELQKDKLTTNELQVGTFKKTLSADPSLGVVRVALKLKDGAQSLGDVTGISVSKTTVLDSTGVPTTPTITLGNLKAE